MPEQSQPPLPPPESATSEEPFPCPACGQMLAPSCRVCVACKHPIDPAVTVRLQPSQAPPPPPAAAQPILPVKFPWRMFLLVLAAWIVIAEGVLEILGLARGQLALGGVQILTSIWVFYDAQHKGLPKPLRWGLGSILLWPIVFPWYLARRKRVEAACPFIEGPTSGAMRALLLLLLLVLFFLLAKGPPQP